MTYISIISPRKQTTMEQKWFTVGGGLQNAMYQGRYAFLALSRHVFLQLEL